MADLTLARNDLAAFAAMLGHPLTDWQAGALGLSTRITAIVAPRQSGKSLSLGVCGLWWALRRPGQRVLIVSAGEEASRRLLGTVRRLAADSPLLAGSVVDEAAAVIRLSNGSEVRCVPASERQVRGWTVDLLLIDEAALVSDDVALSAAFPTTAAREGAKIVIASSPWAEGGFFHSHAVAGDSEHVRVFRWALEDCGWISRAAIEAARASMPAARFAAEFEARWSSSIDSLFSRAVLERCVADVELPSLAALEGPARLLGGLDHGVVHDRSAIGWIARVPVAALNPGWEPGRPVFIAAAQAWPAGQPLSDVVADVAGSRAHWACFSSETNGVGAGPTQELFRRMVERSPAEGGGLSRHVVIEEKPWGPLDEFLTARFTGRSRPPRERPASRWRPWHTVRNPVATSAQTKALVYERLRWLCDRGQLVIARDGDLMRELAALRLELRPGGTERIEAGAGHDDLADALYLGAGPHRVNGRLRAYLPDLADRRTPEADVPLLDEPVVESGGGLRLYRRPPLQSVGGLEVTLPAGVQERGDAELDARRDEIRRAIKTYTNPQQEASHHE